MRLSDLRPVRLELQHLPKPEPGVALRWSCGKSPYPQVRRIGGNYTHVCIQCILYSYYIYVYMCSFFLSVFPLPTLRFSLGSLFGCRLFSSFLSSNEYQKDAQRMQRISMGPGCCTSAVLQEECAEGLSFTLVRRTGMHYLSLASAGHSWSQLTSSV